MEEVTAKEAAQECRRLLALALDAVPDESLVRVYQDLRIVISWMCNKDRFYSQSRTDLDGNPRSNADRPGYYPSSRHYYLVFCPENDE